MTHEVEELIAQYRHCVERQYYWLFHHTDDETSHAKAVSYGLEARKIHEKMIPLRADWRLICGAVAHEVWFGKEK